MQKSTLIFIILAKAIWIYEDFKYITDLMFFFLNLLVFLMLQKCTKYIPEHLTCVSWNKYDSKVGFLSFFVCLFWFLLNKLPHKRCFSVLDAHFLSLSFFRQRFSEEGCLQPSRTQASTRLPTGTLWTATVTSPDTSRYCCVPSLTPRPGMAASACSPIISWGSKTSASWRLASSSVPWNGRGTSLSFPTSRSPTRCHFSDSHGASCSC